MAVIVIISFKFLPIPYGKTQKELGMGPEVDKGFSVKMDLAS